MTSAREILGNAWRMFRLLMAGWHWVPFALVLLAAALLVWRGMVLP